MHKRIPDFIGVGVVKCGTTWAHSQLKLHPQVCSPIKEAHFFNRDRLTPEEYGSLFGQCPYNRICGEWTPDYFISKDAPSRIATYAPDAKLLMIFRNPIDRAWSNYKFAMWKKSIKPMSFSKAFWNVPQIRRRGLYCEHLERWAKQIPKKQIWIGFHDAIVADPRKFMEEIYKFLGINEQFISPTLNEHYKKHYNVRYDHLVMSDKSRRQVRDFYLDSISELEKMLDVDLSGWKE